MIVGLRQDRCAAFDEEGLGAEGAVCSSTVLAKTVMIR